MPKLPFAQVLPLFLLLATPAHAETYAEGLRALSKLTQQKGVEVSRNFFQTTRPGGAAESRWGALEVGDESNVGINDREAEVELLRARAVPGTQFRWCNVHIHRKQAVLRLQKERNEPAPYGNLSFPPSGADVSMSLVSEESWPEWKITGETAIGVVDSYGVWLFRELAGDQDSKRVALYKKHGFSDAELAVEKRSPLDAAEQGRYEYMKAVNARTRAPTEIRRFPLYRQLVLRYAVHESVELVFIPIDEALRGEPCRGF